MDGLGYRPPPGYCSALPNAAIKYAGFLCGSGLLRYPVTLR